MVSSAIISIIYEFIKVQNGTKELAIAEVLRQVGSLRGVRNSDFESEEIIRVKLNEHGISDAEIEQQLARIASNTANHIGVLQNYSLLHSLQHLDIINRCRPRGGGTDELIICLFRCAEVVVSCMGHLAERMQKNLQESRVERAVANARWRAGYQDLMVRISGLLVEIAPSAGGGEILNIENSEIYREYQSKTRLVQDQLMGDSLENYEDIFDYGLDKPSRYMFFNEFVNTSDENIWLSRFRAVRLECTRRPERSTAKEFYAELIQSAEIEAMIGALETREETDLLPFRVVHQVSEIVANTVNEQLCDAIDLLLNQSSQSLGRASDGIQKCVRLLSLADESIRLMLRALTPAAYKAVRPNLGMVQGTSSVVMRKVLFNSTYPLLVQAFKFRLCDEVTPDDITVEVAAERVLGKSDEMDFHMAGILNSLLVMHQQIRTWRDNHLQLPKTHLGLSSEKDEPTVSLSGSTAAVNSAHKLRQRHKDDPIAPLYRVAMGTNPPPVHPLTYTDGFDLFMARQTAKSVHRTYDDVQQRFYRRRNRSKRKTA